MDAGEVSNSITVDENYKDEDVMLPGFRFHPTDEELVGFYLRRKVDKKPISIELIKQIDIYKYDPWDLPSSGIGEKEWYFFCKRGRKYRNSIRPNRVTGSGFWKATGIDKPIFSLKEPHDSIGLKKSLVYYRGSAGKGTKTDWMMHEFRLPPPPRNPNHQQHHHQLSLSSVAAQEAEVWTLCRIFKRIPSYKKYSPSSKDAQNPADSESKTCSLEQESDSSEFYVNFGDSAEEGRARGRGRAPFESRWLQGLGGRQQLQQQRNPNASEAEGGASYCESEGSFWHTNNAASNHGEDDMFISGLWDELRPVVECGSAHSQAVSAASLYINY